MDIHVCVYIYIYVHIELQRFSCVSNSNTICANKHKHIYIHNKQYNVTDDRGGLACSWSRGSMDMVLGEGSLLVPMHLLFPHPFLIHFIITKLSRNKIILTKVFLKILIFDQGKKL